MSSEEPTLEECLEHVEKEYNIWSAIDNYVGRVYNHDDCYYLGEIDYKHLQEHIELLSNTMYDLEGLIHKQNFDPSDY